MRHAHRLAAVAALVCFASPAFPDGAGPSISTKEGVGRVLVDGAGMTLYVFKKDAPGQSAWSGDCLAKWPAYLGTGAVGAGLKAEDFATITRADGARQTTYRGMPLYTFAGDKAAGDAKGQGIKDVWFAAAP